MREVIARVQPLAPEAQAKAARLADVTTPEWGDLYAACLTGVIARGSVDNGSQDFALSCATAARMAHEALAYKRAHRAGNA